MTILPLHDKVYLLSRRWLHHSNHSGYDLLGKFIGTTLTSSPIPDFFLPNRIFFHLTRNMIGYDRTGVALELLAMRHMATHKGCVYHLLYGESTYNYLGYLNGWRDHKIVVTYHKPPKAFEEMVRIDEPVKKLSSVFVVGRNQYASLSHLIPDNRIHFVPYAVDSSYFIPPLNLSERKKNTCLFVGAHLRDFGTLCSVIENAWIIAPQIRFNLVILPSYQNLFKGVVGNYKVFFDIHESELLEMYQTSSLFIMPLRDTTTNTAVLEAMSCGLPMVVSDIGAIRDYTDDNCAHFVSPFHPEEMLNAIISLLKSDRDRKIMSENAREKATNLDWCIISKKIIDIYNQILEHGK